MMLQEYSSPVEEACLEEIVKSFLDIIVLTMLYRRPKHGYRLIKKIHRNFGVLLSPGTLYPFLYNLKEKKLVEMNEKKRKKIYSLTPRGKQKALKLFKYYQKTCKGIFNFIDDNLERS